MRKNIIATLSVLAALNAVAAPAQAARWQTIAQQENGRIELDKKRIARVAQGQTMAWSRLTLGGEATLDGTRYSRVEVLNRYDCVNRRFSTLKRVYLQGIEPVKEDRIDSPREVTIDANTVDERLLTEVCKPRTVGEMREVAQAASQAATQSLPAEQSPAKVMLADVRQLADTPEQAREKAAARIRVSAEHGAEAPVAKIGLPSKSELAARAAAEKAALMPGDVPAPAPAPSSAVKKAVAPAAVAPTHSPSPAAAHNVPASAKPTPEQVFSTYRPYVREVSRGAPRRKPATPPAVQTQAVEKPHVHWSYEGDGRPANWATLRPDYATCATGKRQSPIDIRDGVPVDLETIRFDYKPTFFRIIDNGHTLQVNVGAGSTIQVMGRRFELQQFHFHRPSEERVNGRAYDMVAHLVHKDLDGQLAVIAILLEHGEENPLIQTLWNNMPLEVGQELAPDVSIDLNTLLPKDRAYWTYMGSLTTPPCSEDVIWIVFKQAQPVSPEQVAIFARLYRNNARPIQATNNRLIKGSR